MSEGPHVVIDFETTGLDPALEGILEVAAVRVAQGAIVGEYHSLIKPPVPIGPGSQAIHGITEEMVAEAPPIEAVLPALMRFIGEAPIVAHNAPFDVAFLNRALASHGHAPIANAVYDSLEIAREVLPEQRSYKLEAVCKAFGHPAEGFHRALEDARHLATIWPPLLGLYRQKQAWYRAQYERIAHVGQRYDQISRLIESLQTEQAELKRVLLHYFAEHEGARVPLPTGEALGRASKETFEYDPDLLYPLLEAWGLKEAMLKLDRARLERHLAGERWSEEQKAAVAATRVLVSVNHRVSRISASAERDAGPETVAP